MPRCVPDADDPPCAGLSPQELKDPSYLVADGGVGSPCWSDCGVWDVEIKWVDGRPRVVPAPPLTDSWEDVTLDSIIDQATGSSLFDHPTPVATTNRGKDFSGFRSHECLYDARSAPAWPDTATSGHKQDALVPTGRDDKPTVVPARRVTENPSMVDPGWRKDGKPNSAAPTKPKERAPSVPPYEITHKGEGGERRRKASDQAVEMARSIPGKRSRAAADHHNLSERRRRDKFNQKLGKLQRLIPDSNAKADKVSILDEAISYTIRLQSQVDMMNATFSPTMMMAMSSMMNPIAATTARQLEMVSMAQMVKSMTAGLPHMVLASGGNPFATLLASQIQQEFWRMDSSPLVPQASHQNYDGTANDPRACANI